MTVLSFFSNLMANVVIGLNGPSVLISSPCIDPVTSPRGVMRLEEACAGLPKCMGELSQNYQA